MESETFNTETWNSIWNWISISGALMVVLGGIGIYKTNITLSEKQKAKDATQETKISGLAENNRILAEKTKELGTENLLLSKKTNSLSEKNQELEENNKELKKRAINAERGNATVFEFNGVERKSFGPGKNHATVGLETEIFKKLSQLESEKKYAEIIPLSTETFEKNPKWFTPILFRAEAYLFFGDFEKGERDLKFVKDHIGDDEVFNKYLKKLNELMKELKKK